MAEITAIKYRAFLSYSHHDAASGKLLHGALEPNPIDKDLVGRPTATDASLAGRLSLAYAVVIITTRMHAPMPKDAFGQIFLCK